jgi:predicted MFS family arabinose efflux permease
VPMLLDLGLAATWCGLGALSLLLTVVAWSGWPAETAPPPSPHAIRRSRATLWALYAEYGLNAVGLVPHMVFLVVYVAHGLGQGLETGARYWVLYGAGAMLGPMLAGHLGDRIGFAWALRLAFAAQAVAVALAVLPAGAFGLVVSSLVVGCLMPGVVSLVLGRVHELARPDQAGAAWSLATTAFAVGQAVGAYGMSWLFARTGDYGLLFGLGAGAMLLALLIDLAFARR